MIARLEIVEPKTYTAPSDPQNKEKFPSTCRSFAR
jgi:hypothetical protein